MGREMQFLSRERIKKFYNLKTHIVLTFLFLFLVTFLTIITYSYNESSRAVISLSEDFLERTREGVLSKMHYNLSRAQIFSNLGAQSYNTEEEVHPDNLVLLGTMRSMLQNSSFVTHVSTGTKSGKFLQITRPSEEQFYQSDRTKRIPYDTKFIVRFIAKEGNELKEEWRYENEMRTVVGREWVSNQSYDPREEGWYKEAEYKKTLSWSKIHILGDTQKTGITVSNIVMNDMTNEFVGVFAFDIALQELSLFLKQSKIGDKSVLFVINKRDEIIAHSNMEEAIKENFAERTHIPVLKEIEDEPLQEAYRQYKSHSEKEFFFDVHGKSYIASFANFPRIISYQEQKRIETDAFEKMWVLGMVVPTEEFLGPISQIQSKTILISLLLLSLSIVGMVFLSRRIAKPIVFLAEEAMKIKSFDLTGEEKTKSIVYEIGLLSDAIISMRYSMRAFSKFIPKVLVGKLLKHSHEIKIGGKECRTTFLFTDIADFTTLSENYPPDKLTLHLSEYFEELSTIIFKHKGVIDKYIGDGIMAFWGAPVKDKDQALHACKAAVEIQKRLAILNEQWSAEGKPVLITRCGIHIGNVIVGNMGSSDRINYTALGDTVNLASRLEGTNKIYGTHIMVSQDIVQEVRDKGDFCPIDIVSVKGRMEGVKIFELVGIRDGDPTLLPSQRRAAFCEEFSRCYDLYSNRRWEEALVEFQLLKEKYGDHRMIELYIKRCEEFSENPPQGNWDGITVLTEK